MKNEDIIRMAREAGIETDWSFDFKIRLERFATLVAAHEREACAKVCEETNPRAYMCAAAIRARGDK